MTDMYRISDVLAGAYTGETAILRGWVRTRRDSKGGFSFIELNDGSSIDNIQIIAPVELPNYASEITHIFPGASIEAEGTVVASPGNKQDVELQATRITLIGAVEPQEYPLHKQRMSFEHLRSVAHLRPRTNTFGAITRVRNTLAMAVHDFFQSRGFYWISTPIITASDCEGAGELFQVTTLDLDHPPRTDDGAIDYTHDFFARKAYLTCSGQLDVENYACALSQVYTFGPTFRAENSNTPRHLAEFWMIEPEMAFATLHDDMDVAEAFIKHVIRAALTTCPKDIDFFDKRIQPGLRDALTLICESTFARMTYTDAIETLHAAQRAWEYPVEWGQDLQTEHERYLTEEVCHMPVIVYNWPTAIKPFYMRVNDEEKTVAAMDILVPRFGEIVGGSQREERLEILDARMDALQLDKDTYWWYRDLRRFGTVPHSGFGLGFERLIQCVTGMANIRDVIPFPRTPRNAEF